MLFQEISINVAGSQRLVWFAHHMQRFSFSTARWQASALHIVLLRWIQEIAFAAMAFLCVAAVVENLEQTLAAAFGVDQRLATLAVAEQAARHELRDVVRLQRRHQSV